MLQKLIIAFLVLLFITFSQRDIPFSVKQVYSANEHLVAERSMPLNDRYPVKSVSDVFKDNILLTLAYLSGKVADPAHLNWDEVRSASQYEVVLQPGQVFAFHDDVLPAYQGKTIITTNAHFDSTQGFESDGYLVGDGVCHFASLINWAARDAGLSVVAPTNHDFANIPDVPRQYGTAIYYMPGSSTANQLQNLYVENTFDKPVHMVFRYDGNDLSVSIYK